MKAAVTHKPMGKESLRIEDVKDEAPGDGEVRVKMEAAGMNPIDYMTIAGKVLYNLAPIPHIPGAEALGTAQNDGKWIKKGDRVLVYPRLHCGRCHMCLSGREYLCSSGGLWGVASNGGYREFFNVPEQNLAPVPEGLSSEVAVSLPVGGLTAYHALMRAGASHEKRILIYGASGNTGIFATQLASLLGLQVHAVSRKAWISDYGADKIYAPGEVPEDLAADIVLNSIGQKFWKESMDHLAPGGSLVTFGVQTGREAEVDIGQIYTGERSIIGSTGGSMKELVDLMDLVSRKGLKVRVSRKFRLSEIQEALKHYEEIRDGRIVLTPP